MKTEKKDQDMSSVKVKTSDIFMDTINSVAESMIKEGLTEKSFSVPGTALKFILVKKGTPSEETRVSDVASIIGGEYDFGDSKFLLARR
jgi:hypothetical protein